MRWNTIIFAAALLLQGCASPPPPSDGPEGHYVLEQGANEISGEAAIISSEGYRRGCEDAALLPVTPSWRAWAHQAFGNRNYAPRIALRNMPREAPGSTRHTDCDGEGQFRFNHVADGNYYLFSTIFWLLRWQQNGGGFLQEVEVHGGRKAVISMIKDWRLP